jgi:hypothetical protein
MNRKTIKEEEERQKNNSLDLINEVISLLNEYSFVEEYLESEEKSVYVKAVNDFYVIVNHCCQKDKDPRNHYFNLSSTKIGENMYNLPQYNTDITLWKGIENTINFSIRDRDRKGYSLEGNELFINIINPKLNKKITKKLEIIDEYKGLYNVSFSQSELRDFEPTYYQASITALNNNIEEILYSGTEWNPIFKINVKEGLRDVFKPSEKIISENFLYSYYNDEQTGLKINRYTSHKLKADETDSHTASILIKENFIGKIIMEASVESTPSENDWFEIDAQEIKESDEEKITTFMFNKQLNCLWIRFRCETSENELNITEILYRN